ncbi:uncharacterized protein YALI1_A15863g [Yarrowia lipolytica]|uniref:NADP-dependent oxidoreductase domain-containing protein n=1 Tax=Yarrowia lipolytica TaxID=4952 RepID=A0A1D8N4Z0_YARLL|nr:hypothetical protein YALI1_A15863g [Yarrowia lipolytica]
MTSIDFTMNNGKTIPASEVAGAVRVCSHQGGYPTLDTAFNYRNGALEPMEKGVKARDIFVTTKIWVTYHDRVEENLNIPVYPLRPDGSRDIDESRLPSPNWKQMEAGSEDWARPSLSVFSNFSIPYLQGAAQRGATVVPAVNQGRAAPSAAQAGVMEFCKKNKHHHDRSSPFGSVGGPLLKNRAGSSSPTRDETSPADSHPPTTLATALCCESAKK